MGVELRVVERDASGPYRVPHIPDTEARYRVVAVHRRGGMLDAVTRRWVGPSKRPKMWHASPRGASLILHERPESGQLVLGGEGSGKTRLGAQWWIWHGPLELRNVQCGITAPTLVRVREILTAIAEHSRPDWYEHFSEAQELRWRTGVVGQYRSVAIRSETEGSPIQAFTWARCLSDEWQDYAESIENDIETRGRGAPEGRYLRMITCTPKPTPDCRTRISDKRTSSDWTVETLRGRDNAFVPPAHWERLKRTLSPREYRRREGGEDMAPERALYTQFDRERNLLRLRQVPRARDVTAEVMYARWGIPYDLLCGHDPGEIQDVTVFLRAYDVPGVQGYTWWIVGELTTERSTTDKHVAELRGPLAKLRSTRPLIVGDPWIAGEKHPDKTVANAFKRAGFDIRPAAYSQDGGPGWIKKEARIELVDRLFHAEDGTSRLYFAADDYGHPLAKRTMESAESAERDDAGKPEAQRKNKRDLSHWMAGVGYALWPMEKLHAVAGARR